MPTPADFQPLEYHPLANVLHHDRPRMRSLLTPLPLARGGVLSGKGQ
jgi:hypothetical protein